MTIKWQFDPETGYRLIQRCRIDRCFCVELSMGHRPRRNNDEYATDYPGGHGMHAYFNTA